MNVLKEVNHHFYHYIHITDEVNLKHKSKVLNEFIVTKKMDGSSMTLIWDNDLFFICSRKCTLYKIKGDDVIITSNEDMVNFSSKYGNLFKGKFTIIQGEMCGPKYNKNRLKSFLCFYNERSK